MRSYHVNGLPGLFTYLELVTRVQNGRNPPPPVGVAPPVPLPTLGPDAMVRGENDPVGSEVRIDSHPDFVAVFPRATRAPASGTPAATTPTTGNGRGWLHMAAAAVLGILGLWLVLFVLIPGLFAVFGSPNIGWSNGSIAQAQAQATKAQADADAAKKEADAAKLQAADAKKAADEAKSAAALADAKAKGAVAELNGIKTCPGGSKDACIALLKSDGLSDVAAAEGCAPSCVSATP